MTDRERLIELTRKAKKNTKGANCDLEREMLFADYLLDNGVIVPPCRLNQRMWEASGYEIDECKVSSLTQKADGSFKIRLTILRYKSVFEITTDAIGKTVFLTLEEAEKALAERSSNNA